MGTYQELTQRDLQTRSGEILDAIERGRCFTITRCDRPIGELVPLRNPRRFVPKQKFVAASRNAPAVDLGALRADQDMAFDHEAFSKTAQ